MTVIVTDTFEIESARPGARHDAGLVVVFDASQLEGPIPPAGFVIAINTPSGSVSELSIDESKEHGAARSFFFSGLRKADVPVGSRMIWSHDNTEWRRSVRQSVAG